MHARTAFLAAAALALSACGARQIPGTEIRDTPDNRAVFDLVRAYTQAFQAEDAPAVLALVSPQYFDTAGTPDPADDLDYARLSEVLPKDFADKVEGLRLELTVRDIQVQGDRATADVFYDAWYRVQTPSGTVPRRDSDLHRLVMRKAEGRWKIVSGI